MKKFLNFFLLALLSVAVCSCGDNSKEDVNGPNSGQKPDQPDKPGDPTELTVANLAGDWVLTKWKGENMESEKHTVYLRLTADSQFTMYQLNINAVGMQVFTGTFTLDSGAKTISGTYSDGQKWGSTYAVSNFTSTTMVWTADGTDEVSNYTRKAIPDEILNYPAAASVLAAGQTEFRFL